MKKLLGYSILIYIMVPVLLFAGGIAKPKVILVSDPTITHTITKGEILTDADGIAYLTNADNSATTWVQANSNSINYIYSRTNAWNSTYTWFLANSNKVENSITNNQNNVNFGTNLMVNGHPVLTNAVSSSANVYTTSNNTFSIGTIQTLDRATINSNFTLQQGSDEILIYNTSADQVVIGNAGRGTNSVVIGYRALSAYPQDVIGKGAVIAIGHEAGYNVTNSTSSIFIGYDAGYNAPNSANSVMIGNQAGVNASGQTTVFLGTLAGANADGSGSSFMSGYAAGDYASNSPYSDITSYEAGYNANSSTGISLHGNAAGYNASHSPYLFAQGYSAGYDAANASNSIMIGKRSGQYATNSAYSIFIGEQSGADIQRANTLVIDSNPSYSRSTNALIYGEFDNRKVVVNGSLTPNSIIFTNTIVTLSAGYFNGTNALILNFSDAPGTNYYITRP